MAICTATFEYGTNGSNILTTDPGAGTPWDNRSVTGPHFLTYDSTVTHSGGLSAKYVLGGSSAQCRVDWLSNSFGSNVEHYGRTYAFWGGYPTGGVPDSIFGFLCSGSGGVAWKILPSGLFEIGDAGFTAYDSTKPVPLNTWMRIEWHIVHNPTTGSFEFRLYHSPESLFPTETITFSNKNTGVSASDQAQVGTGQSSAASQTFWFDDIYVGASNWVGPATSPMQPVLSHMGRVSGG